MTSKHSDLEIASSFTPTIRTHPTPTTDPSTNKFPTPLNVLIIGASRGIGEGIAHAYAQAGAGHLFLAARASSAAKLDSVAQKARELNPSVQVTNLHVDITSVASVAQLAQEVSTKCPRLDVLILNSGYAGPFSDKVEADDPREFAKCFDVNVNGTYNVAHYFLPLLTNSASKKTFIVVSSFALLVTNEPFSNPGYCASKLAQARLIEIMAEQYVDQDVLMVAVHPGAVATEMGLGVPESVLDRMCYVV